MKGKMIKKMSREELLELLIQYSEEKEALELRVAELEEKLSQAQKKLEDRAIAISSAGSLAQAAMQLSGVFEAAQIAADLYLENIRQLDTTKKEAAAQWAPQTDIQQTSMRRRKRGMGL